MKPYRRVLHLVINADPALSLEETRKELPGHWEGGRIPEGKCEHPVVHVPWADAVAFCEWLSRWISKDEDEQPVRLPTEAEWKYAARGEGGRKYPWSDAEPSDRLANFGRNVGDTTPVGSYPDGATPEGVQDLAGNVWEWCGDWFGSYPPEDEEDPTGPHSGSSRVLRGGAFNDSPGDLRAASRNDGRPEGRYGFDRLGFRLCRGGARGP